MSIDSAFIVVDGVEGAGKSTNMNYIAQLLNDAGKKVCVTREPGGTSLGEAIRDLILHFNKESIDAATEVLMLFAARAHHIRHVINPALAKGEWVLCDRFTDSSYAYQGAARGLGNKKIADLEHWVQGSLRPDLVLLLDIDPEQGLSRASVAGDNDRIHNEALSFHNATRKAYLERAALDTKRYAVISSDQDYKQVRQAIAQRIEDFIASRSDK